MGRQQDQQQPDAVVAAIERVLKVERDGVQQLQQSEDHARRLLSDAWARSAAIARRADDRISRLHTAYLQKIQQDILELAESSASTGEPADHSYDRATLAAAARRVAAKLTGGP